MFKKILFIFALLPCFILAQHSIKGRFFPAEDYKWVLLYKITPETAMYIDNAEVNENGNFEIQLDSTQTSGIYKLVYAIPQEDYNIEIIYNAKEDIVFNFSQETGIEFQTSTENKILTSYTNNMALVSNSIGEFFNQESVDTLALASMFQTQKETQLAFETEAEGTIALNFIKASKPYIPDNFEDITSYINNLKLHFFDQVDFNNETLQSSNFLIDKMLNYVFGLSSKTKDDTTTYKENIDAVFLAMMKADPKIKKELLGILWQQMAALNLEEVANYISDEYLIKISKALNDKKLVDELVLYKNLSIGAQAPDFLLEEATNKTTKTKRLSDLDTATNYIIVFWSSSCSHCLEEIPLLQTYLKTLEINQVKVIAVGLEDDSYNWQNKIYDFPEFTHVLGLGKWDNKIGNDYNINATPTYFVLDKDKKILFKPYDFEALKKFFEN